MKQEIEILTLPPKNRHESVDIEIGSVYSYPIHGHLYYEILVYGAFEGEITVNGEKFDTSRPTAIMISPNDFHSITVHTDKSATYHKIYVQHEYIEGIYGHLLESVVTQDQQKLALLTLLCKEAYANRQDRPYLEAFVQTIILTLQKNATGIALCNKSTALIREAIEIINTRFAEPITLASTAKELHVSPQYLSNLFSHYAEMSYIAYLTERRLHYATMLLRSGGSVSEVCFRSGYRNLSHFIRSFKRKYGVTPAKYVQSMQNEKRHGF